MGRNLLKNEREKLNPSASAYYRILNESRTITDLRGSDQIKPEHLAEAIHYRNLGKESGGG